MQPQPALFTEVPDPHRIRRSARVSRDGQERYELRRWWIVEPKRWVSWLMFNPSIADGERDDPTVKRIIGFSQRWGYDGLIVANLYPFVTPNPDEALRRADYMAHGPDWYERDRLMWNRGVLEAVAREAALRMVAFGALALRSEMWMEACLEDYDSVCDTDLCCLGTTQSGMPVHPLARGKHRIPDSREPLLWIRP